MTWLYGVVSRQNPRRPTIINLSLGGEYSDTMNQYVQTMAEIGILVVTASGNSNSDACLESPASAALAISVASSGRTDEFSSFSNWGACVDVIAPGENILSASYTGEGALIKSGTSQACPLVAGLAAIFWESSLRNGTNVTIQQLAETMKNNVNTNLITNTPEGTVNSLAHASACSQPRVNSAVRMPMSVGLFVAAALVSVALLA
ncbi:hypothetical protein SARC_07898 [Sphaeroforma arctica JP610]|uniref:Peptidase S8/S53 domain-containing protein n=1 Tax=Sphaeroforma arctica JP610 TaxID=667725 RepID=A0A0L0FUV8_9EUKA|nr:hypothetical protein SARC_07898 [Sphaeroforma arctica JP610]KNC79723.1 hypothetical protein SARC_07898 [Sphaeroforma arctica JP610]|eukprot:XP_014153625.1 hypothetical protein SARC_07898 [Sphaeroforma arctica JP610]